MANKIEVFSIFLQRLNIMEGNMNQTNKKMKLFYVIGGVAVGFLSGLFGGGGGMLAVPLLIWAGKLAEKEAHATAIAVILPLTVVSGAVYVFSGSYDLSLGLPIGLGFIGGGILGSLLLKKLSCKALCVIFSLVMIVGGVRILW